MSPAHIHPKSLRAMPLSPILRKAHWAVLVAVSFYLLALISLTNPWLQRHVLYSHKLRTPWVDLNKPEQFGFAKNQVTPFNFSTSDQEIIYAWHIVPLGLYAKHESGILQRAPGIAEDVTSTTAFKLLRDDSNAKLVIIFHGNAGHIAQGWRTDSYRALSDGSTSDIHILAFDYRGFGVSTGFPTEEGLIKDGIAAVNWATGVAKVPTNRIVIVGQSLGTAVSTAVAEHFAKGGIEFLGVVLVAGFTDLPNLLLSYSIAGFIPLLSPFRMYPKLYRFFADQLVDTWPSADRLANFVKLSKRVRLFIIHSKDDFEIPWTQSEGLFAAATNATTDEGMKSELLIKMKARMTVDMGDGAFISTWKAGGNKIIREEIVNYGYHSRILTYAPVALSVLKAFEVDGDRGSSSFVGS